jgi:phosphate starvation-inducible membrane PsiE
MIAGNLFEILVIFMRFNFGLLLIKKLQNKHHTPPLKVHKR